MMNDIIIMRQVASLSEGSGADVSNHRFEIVRRSSASS